MQRCVVVVVMAVPQRTGVAFPYSSEYTPCPIECSAASVLHRLEDRELYAGIPT